MESSAMGGFDAVAFSTNEHGRADNNKFHLRNGPDDTSKSNDSSPKSVGNESLSYGEQRIRMA